MKKRLLLTSLLLSILALAGCATQETPMSVTAKGLLTSRLAVIGMAETGDTLCSKGVLKQQDCDNIKEWYGQAQVAYKTGSDAMLAWVVTGQDGGNQAESSLATMNSLLGNMQGIVNAFAQPTGGK